MANFSWSDGLRAALSPCITCLRPRSNNEDDDSIHGPDHVPRARSDELEGLLADVDDAETLSLHSNIGQDRGRRKKHPKSRKTIRLFGFDLFGRPPIQLPDDDDDARPRARTISASTLDSDAAPLDPSTIDQLSAARLAESATQREAERRAKEERRRRRREKKALQQAALAAALARGEGTEQFEGFPGSGGAYDTPLYHGPGTHSSDARSSSTQDDFGPFERGQPSPHYQDDVDGDAADFGGEFYSPPRRAKSGSSGSGSGSHSRTSGSVSNAIDSVHYNHHFISQQPMSPTLPDMPIKKKKSSKSSSRHSASTASQSNSIASPPPNYTSFPAIAEQDSVPHAEQTISPPPQHANGFPSVGFGGGLRRKNSEAGVFLARRGDE